jgi:hypothetical protein
MSNNDPPSDEFRTIEGAIAANRPCARHCDQCEGEDHHWIPECPEEGDPLMVCKHCPAWREMTAEDDEDIVVLGTLAD